MPTTPVTRPTFRNITARSLKNLLDPGPHRYPTYITSGRTFFADDIPGPSPDAPVVAPPLAVVEAFTDAFDTSFEGPL